MGIKSPGGLLFSAIQVDVVGILVVQVETFTGLRGAYVLCYGLCDIPGEVPLGEVKTGLRIGRIHFGENG